MTPMIVLATPTRDTVTTGYTGDLLQLCRRHPEVGWVAALGVYLPNLRQECVYIALQMAASHILFIDSDMRFPVDTLDQLLARNHPIIGANCVQRTKPDCWTARKDGRPLSSVGRSGVEIVDAVGFGVMLLQTAIFDDLPRPWFDTPYDGQNHLGEDIYFCQQATRAGFPVRIDHDLSQQVRHQGLVEYGAQTVEVHALSS